MSKTGTDPDRCTHPRFGPCVIVRRYESCGAACVRLRTANGGEVNVTADSINRRAPAPQGTPQFPFRPQGQTLRPRKDSQ